MSQPKLDQLWDQLNALETQIVDLRTDLLAACHEAEDRGYEEGLEDGKADAIAANNAHCLAISRMQYTNGRQDGLAEAALLAQADTRNNGAGDDSPLERASR